MIYWLQVPDKLPREIQKQVDNGAAIIRRGGVVAFPTDTLFGLGAGAYIEPAILRIFDIKKRPLSMALPLLLGDVSQIHEVASYLTDYGWRLVERFLPGGLTLVVHRSQIVKDIITARGNTVAIRIPDHPVALALIQGSGMPIVGTSANLSGQPNAGNADDIRAQLGDLVDLIIDGGPPPGGIESTVVDVTGVRPVIVRQGHIPRSEIEMVVKLA